MSLIPPAVAAVGEARTAFAEVLGDALSFDLPGQELIGDLIDGAGGLAGALELTGDFRSELLPSFDLSEFALSAVTLISGWTRAGRPVSGSGLAVDALTNVYDRAVDDASIPPWQAAAPTGSRTRLAYRCGAAQPT